MTGQASSAISVNQTAQHGDKTALDRAKKSMTSTPMTGNPTPQPTAGRPPGSTLPSSGTDVPMPTVHAEAINDFALKTWTARTLQEAAMQPGAGPLTKMYAQASKERYKNAAVRVKNRTPNFG